MALPVDIRDLFKYGKEIARDRERPVGLVVLVEVDAPEDLLEAVQGVLRPHTALARVDVGVIGESPEVAPGPETDAVVVLVGGASRAVADAIAGARSLHTPVVALASREGPGDLDYALGQPTEDLLTGTDAKQLAGDDLAGWLADRLAGKRVALAANFTFARRAVAHDVVRSTAWQNALIGSVAILPGTDMPLMTANQAKMLLMLASAYGQRISADRLKELAAVVGGGFLFRTLARQALTVVPGFGWAVKGSVAFSGTMAMGRAAIAWFEEGADMHEVVERFRSVTRERRVLGKRGTGLAAVPGGPAVPRIGPPGDGEG